MRSTAFSFIFAALSAATVLGGCGRNPGAVPRSYPGMERIDAEIDALEAAQPKCVSFDSKRLGEKVSVSGKENFITDRQGEFRLESYRIAQAIDRPDRVVPNSVFDVSEFADPGSQAPRLSVEASCLDLKGASAAIAVSPATRIDSATGLVLESQPFDLSAGAAGKLSARSRVPTETTGTTLPAGKLPEAAILLGSSYSGTFKTLGFRASATEDGSLSVHGRFIGVDPETLSRIYLEVDAVYGWDSAE